jgi:hypothetical protein
MRQCSEQNPVISCTTRSFLRGFIRELFGTRQAGSMLQAARHNSMRKLLRSTPASHSPVSGVRNATTFQRYHEPHEGKMEKAFAVAPEPDTPHKLALLQGGN